MQKGSGDSLFVLSVDVFSKYPDCSQNWYHLFSKSFGLKVLFRLWEFAVLSVLVDIKFFFLAISHWLSEDATTNGGAFLVRRSTSTVI
jgi:hypothetical protein